jgi:hypothetical protein
MQPPRIELSLANSSETLEWDARTVFTWSVGIGFIIADHILAGFRYIDGGKPTMHGTRFQSDAPAEGITIEQDVSLYLLEIGFRI